MKEKNMKTVKTYLVRKPSDLEEVETLTRIYSNEAKIAVIAEIAETIHLTPKQYKNLCNNPLRNYQFLEGKGGYENDVRQVVELTCKGEKSLYADPSGSSYCRYLGIEVE